MAQTIEKDPMQDRGFEMHMEILQPWSNFVMKTKSPSSILERMIKITDKTIENREGTASDKEIGVGQVETQFFLDFEMLKQEKVQGFFMDVCRQYVIQAFCQSQPFNKEQILKEEWYTSLTNGWINSQKPNEYIASHNHGNCHVALVMYLKIPKFLPSRNLYTFNDWFHIAINTVEEDGAICFTSNASKDKVWGEPILTLQPEVGDIFVFSASQGHQVYPFRTADGKGERRSISINAIFSSKTEQDNLKEKKQYEAGLIPSEEK